LGAAPSADAPGAGRSGARRRASRKGKKGRTDTRIKGGPSQYPERLLRSPFSGSPREINCYLMFGGCEIVAQEEEDPRSPVEGGWVPAGRDAREHGSVGGAALGCGVPGQEEEEVSYVKRVFD
jgi:hypothetical protein